MDSAWDSRLFQILNGLGNPERCPNYCKDLQADIAACAIPDTFTYSSASFATLRHFQVTSYSSDIFTYLQISQEDIIFK